MTKFYTGYEAPSTAHENTGHPSLEIGGCQRLQLFSAHTLLPHSMTLKARCSPVYCSKEMTVSLSGYDIAPICPYRSYKALEHIDLWLEQDGHYCFSQGVRKPLDLDPDWDVLLKGKPFYSIVFETLQHDVCLGEADEFIPYGGSFGEDPAQCVQTYFKARWDQNNIDLIMRSHPSQSLKTMIETKNISVFLTYCGQPYKYTSVAYTLTEQKEVFIEFIASF